MQQTRRALTFVMLAGVAAFTPAAMAGVPQERPEAEAKAALDRGLALVRSGATTEALMDAAFWPDLVFAGEGSETIRSRDKTLAMLRAFLSTYRDCRFTYKDPAIVSSTVAAFFVQESCKGRGGVPDEEVRVLYVLQKRGSVWKIALESFSSGQM